MEKWGWGTQLPACHLLMLAWSLPPWEKRHDNTCDSRIWGLLKGLYLTILGHADLGLREGHKVIHLSMTSRKRQTLSADTDSPSLQREDLVACLLGFCKGTQLTLHFPTWAPGAGGGHPDTCTLHSSSQLHPGTAASGARKHGKFESVQLTRGVQSRGKVGDKRRWTENTFTFGQATKQGKGAAG